MKQLTSKRQAARKALMFIEDGMMVGLGSGKTINVMLEELALLVEKGLTISSVSSSNKTTKLASNLGIPVLEVDQVKSVDIAIDGADEVDPAFNLVKGGGGSLLREKMVLELADCKVIIVDESKRVDKLGNFPIPVEITPFAVNKTKRNVAETGCVSKLRLTSTGLPFVTDNGNYILDCMYEHKCIDESLHTTLKLMTGVVETGIFIDLADFVVTGSENEVKVEQRKIN